MQLYNSLLSEVDSFFFKEVPEVGFGPYCSHPARERQAGTPPALNHLISVIVSSFVLD